MRPLPAFYAIGRVGGTPTSSPDAPCASKRHMENFRRRKEFWTPSIERRVPDAEYLVVGGACSSRKVRWPKVCYMVLDPRESTKPWIPIRIGMNISTLRYKIWFETS